MTRYVFRGCRRCGGDLYINYENRRNADWLCLQCGHHPEPRAAGAHHRQRADVIHYAPIFMPGNRSDAPVAP